MCKCTLFGADYLVHETRIPDHCSVREFTDLLNDEVKEWVLAMGIPSPEFARENYVTEIIPVVMQDYRVWPELSPSAHPWRIYRVRVKNRDGPIAGELRIYIGDEI